MPIVGQRTVEMMVFIKIARHANVFPEYPNDGELYQCLHYGLIWLQ